MANVEQLLQGMAARQIKRMEDLFYELNAQVLENRKAKPAPKPEPVEWKFYFNNGTRVTVYNAREAAEIRRYLEEDEREEVVYAAQPKKEWVGLTDEERKEILKREQDFWGLGWELKAAEAIEDKLKDKNHD